MKPPDIAAIEQALRNPGAIGEKVEIACRVQIRDKSYLMRVIDLSVDFDYDLRVPTLKGTVHGRIVLAAPDVLFEAYTAEDLITWGPVRMVISFGAHEYETTRIERVREPVPEGQIGLDFEAVIRLG